MKKYFVSFLLVVFIPAVMLISGFVIINKGNTTSDSGSSENSQYKDVSTPDSSKVSLTPSPLSTGNTSDQNIGNKDDTDNSNTRFFYNKPARKPVSVQIKIFKKQRVLELYENDAIFARFKIGLGHSPEGDKNKEGDSKTPVGEYYICSRNEKSSFHLFLGLSYPNLEDAQRGLSNGLINQATFKKIKRTQEMKQLPPWDTPLGGAVGIHGGGNSRDWTLGCIALNNEDVEILWEYAKLKTPVLIYE